MHDTGSLLHTVLHLPAVPRRHNLYVGLLLEAEARLAAKADAQMGAMRQAEEVMLCQLLAAACV